MDQDFNITFTFHDHQPSDVPEATHKLNSDDAVTQCFIANRKSYKPDGPPYPVPEPE